MSILSPVITIDTIFLLQGLSVRLKFKERKEITYEDDDSSNKKTTKRKTTIMYFTNIDHPRDGKQAVYQFQENHWDTLKEKGIAVPQT